MTDDDDSCIVPVDVQCQPASATASPVSQSQPTPSPSTPVQESPPRVQKVVPFCFSNVIKLLSFLMAALLSLIVTALCCTQLIRSAHDIDKTIYISMLSAVVSLWMPSPSTLLQVKTKTTNAQPKPSTSDTTPAPMQQQWITTSTDDGDTLPFDTDDDDVITIATRSMKSHQRQPSKTRSSAPCTIRMGQIARPPRARTKRMYLVSPAVVDQFRRYQHDHDAASPKTTEQAQRDDSSTCGDEDHQS